MESLHKSPQVKFEHSPAESFVSLPGDGFPSLFSVTTPLANNSLNPMEMLSPLSFTDEKPSPSQLDEDDSSPPPGCDKKTAKKRKSWGQVLPEPKTNLPPRKRAKTQDEKEQRRVERVLRNRRAAQSSRERKRLEVEALEQKNKVLEDELLLTKQKNLLLTEELKRFRQSSGITTRSASPLESLHANPLSLSQELFSSQDGHSFNSGSNLMDDILGTDNPTVNPASISPELGPVADSSAKPQPSRQIETIDLTKASHEMTQLPAEMFPVRPSLANLDAASLGLAAAAPDDVAFSLGDPFGLSSIEAECPVLESGLLASPESSAFDDDYLVGDSGSSFNHQSDFELFDINDFLNDDNGKLSSELFSANDMSAANNGYGDFENFCSEIQRPSEKLNQQPDSGASPKGCDDGGIAVGI
ncbi:hypothetical protein G7046_g4111 [Stylonectria norvegica]|nr:hypothetical protein G7046_g4111 [Stylonectria norvegica]